MTRVRTPTQAQIAAAASELASQERYNPNWVKPEDWGNHRDLYEQRARLILEAALEAQEPR